MTTHPDRQQPQDELDRMALALHDVLHEEATARTLDWGRVERLRTARRRHRRVAAAAATLLALAAALAAVFVVPGLGSDIPSGGSPSDRTARSTSPVPPQAGPRVLLDDGRTRVLADAAADASIHGGTVVRLETGRVWVRVRHAADGSPLPGPAVCVQAPDLRACVHGTAFEVTAPPRGLAAAPSAPGSSVVVVEGVVEVTRPDAAAILVPAGSRFAPPYAGLEAAPADALDLAIRTLEVPAARPERAQRVEGPFAPPERAQRVEGPPPYAPPVPAGPAPAVPVEPAPVAAVRPQGATATDAGPTADGALPVEDVESLYRAAERALVEGRAADALDLLERIAETAPHSVIGGLALFDVAETYRRTGRPAEARRAFLRYLAAQPAGSLRGEARVRVCRIDAAAGRFADAATCYASYLTEYPAGAYAAEARRATSDGGEELRKRP